MKCETKKIKPLAWVIIIVFAITIIPGLIIGFILKYTVAPLIRFFEKDEI